MWLRITNADNFALRMGLCHAQVVPHVHVFKRDADHSKLRIVQQTTYRKRASELSGTIEDNRSTIV